MNNLKFFMGPYSGSKKPSLRQIAKNPSRFFPWMYPRKEFLNLLSRDPLLHSISPYIMLSEIRSEISDNCTKKETRDTALLVTDLFEKVYPRDQHNLRDDGTHTQDHPLTIAYRCMRAGADLDVILAALLHDTKEDGKIKNLDNLYKNLTIPKTRADPVLLSECWTIVRILTHKLSGTTIKGYKDDLKKSLKAPKDLNLLDTHNKWLSVRSDYITYVTTLYQSGNIPAILLKEMDTLHNLQSAYHLNPKKDFYRIFTTIWKALTHIDHAKKLSYSFSSELILSLSRLWERMQMNMDTSTRVLYELGHDIFRHQYLVSDDQIKLEEVGFARPPPRRYFNPRRAAYDRTVPEINMPREGQWIQTIKSHRLPVIRAEVEFPLKRYFELENKKREYIQYEQAFEVVYRSDIRTSIKQNKRFDMFEMPSMQFPSLRSGVMIFEVQTPKEINDLGKRLISNNPATYHLYSDIDSRFWDLVNEYEDLLVKNILEIYDHAKQLSDKRQLSSMI